MAQASTRDTSSSGEERNVIRERSVRELMYALVATGITLVLAILFYLYVPILREQMRDADENLKHSRVFVPDAEGGVIRYEFTVVEGGEDHDTAVDHYIEDLELLGRRFQRGEFAMVLLPGMKDSSEYAAMRQHVNDFQYQVVKDAEGPALKIRTADPAARQALHDYLKYLEARWVF